MLLQGKLEILSTTLPSLVEKTQQLLDSDLESEFLRQENQREQTVNKRHVKLEVEMVNFLSIMMRDLKSCLQSLEEFNLMVAIQIEVIYIFSGELFILLSCYSFMDHILCQRCFRPFSSTTKMFSLIH
jgi:hypothetical protein